MCWVSKNRYILLGWGAKFCRIIIPYTHQRLTKTAFNTLVTYPEERGTTLRRSLCKDVLQVVADVAVKNFVGQTE